MAQLKSVTGERLLSAFMPCMWAWTCRHRSAESGIDGAYLLNTHRTDMYRLDARPQLFGVALVDGGPYHLAIP